MHITGLVFLVVLSLCFPAAAVFNLVRHRKRERAGSQLFALEACPKDDGLRFNHGFEITTKGKWCRIKTTFGLKRNTSANAPNLHWYTIALSDAGGKLLYTEQRSMADFFYFSWHRQAAFVKKEVEQSTCEVILLEFMPPGPGQYWLGFTIAAIEPKSEIKSLTIATIEGVWPCRKHPYRHTCIDLRRLSHFKANDQDIG